MPSIDIEIDKAAGLAVAENCVAAVNCPSASASMKDGYAVVAQDLKNASKDSPVKFKVTGSVFAGSQEDKSVVSGTAVKIMTGAKIPQGADAVIPSELTKEKDDEILCCRDAGVGRNILRKGHDVKKGDKDWTQIFYAGLVRKGGQLFVEPIKTKSRLQSQADADALIKIAEGIELLEKGEQIQIQVLFNRTQQDALSEAN